MNTYIILLRGVNVSGKNKLPMKDLKNALTTKGYVDVQTYIQSGNLVLKTEESEEKIKQETKATIRCIPFESNDSGLCIVTGKKSKGMVFFARSY